MEDIGKKIKDFDNGREAAKRDRAIYGHPYPYGQETEFGKGYWYEWKK